MRKTKFEGVLVAVLMAYALMGCSDKINQTGSWLVGYDNNLNPRYFSSDSVKTTSSQVNIGLANGSSTSLCVGKLPWTEARMLLEFSGLDSVYYASSITSAEIILTRAPNTLQPPGTNVQSLQFEGFTLDSTWNSSTYTWDSVNAVMRGTTNIVLSQPTININDSTVTMYIDTGTVRQWAIATQDTSVKNRGFILIPQNEMGVLNVYSALSTTGAPKIVVACTINGITDTVSGTPNMTTFIAQSYPAMYNPSFASPNTYQILQGGTGLREQLTFDLSKIPNYSIVNYAQLTIYSDTLDSAYYHNSTDSVLVYYITNPSTYAVSTVYYGLSARVGNKYIINVTTGVQMMLNHGNYGFLITAADEYTNVDSRIVYDENAPDSLKPKLTVTYSPAGKR